MSSGSSYPLLSTAREPWEFHATDLLHLFLHQPSASPAACVYAHVATVTHSQHVLPERLDRRAGVICPPMAAWIATSNICRRDQFIHFLHQLAALVEALSRWTIRARRRPSRLDQRTSRRTRLDGSKRSKLSPGKHSRGWWTWRRSKKSSSTRSSAGRRPPAPGR